MNVVQAGVAVVLEHFNRSDLAVERFFAREAPAVARVCEALADCFGNGGRLLVLGAGAQTSDAHHVAVEFVHPVIVGKRALPALVVSDGAGDEASERLRLLAQPHDAVLALCASAPDAATARALRVAAELDVFSVVCAGAPSEVASDAGFVVRDADPMVVQEVHETLYHVLWELVHVFLDHQTAGAEVAGATRLSPDEAALYPFLSGGAAAPPHALREEVARSTLAKSVDIRSLRHRVCAEQSERIAAAAEEMALRLQRGARLLAFGNGGSATDAADAVADCLRPPLPGWRAIPAVDLTAETGIITAVANDVGFEHVFARQVAAFGGPDDIALGISTSGTSMSVLAALEAAHARGAFTIALTGGDGGRLARSQAVDACVIVPSDYTPRIQEAHATIWHALLSVVHERWRS